MITARQRDLLRFIERHQREHGVSPSFAEMATGLGVVKSNVHRLLVGLEARGAIRRIAGHARAIEILKREPKVSSRTETGDDRLIRREELERWLGLSKGTIYNLVNDGVLPPPIRLSPKPKSAVRWRKSEIDEYLANCPRGFLPD